MKIGILGLGRAGRRHAMNATALDHNLLMFDPDNPGNPTTRAEVLQDADAIIISSPSEFHLEDLRDCIAAGKPVLVEKPIALTGQSENVEGILAAAEAKGLPVATGFNLRFHPAIVQLVKVLERRPYYGSFWCCQYTESPGPLTNGCINEWAPHEIDLAMYLMDDPVLRVIDKYIDRLEVNLGLIGWGNGCHVHIHSDMRYRGNLRGGHVLTEKNEYRWDFAAHPVSSTDYLAELKAFIEYVQTGVQPLALASGQDGLAVLKLCERADNVRLGK